MKLIPHVAVGLWRHPKSMPRPQISEEMREMLGLAPGEPCPTLEEMAAFFDWPEQFDEIKDVVSPGGEAFAADVWIRAPSGRRRRVRLSAMPEYDADGAFVGMGGAAVDITNLLELAARSQENETLLATFVDNAPVALAMFDTEMRYLRVSPRWLSDYGLEGQEVVGRSHYVVFPEIGDDWKSIHRACLAGGVSRAERELFVRADGRRQWIAWEVRPWRDAHGAIGGLLMMTRDVTELVESLEQTERSERRLNLALEVSGMMVWQREARTGRISAGGAINRFFNKDDPKDVSIQDVRALLPPDLWEPMFAGYRAAREKGTVYREEHPLRPGKDGAPRWALTVIEPQRDAHGNYIGAIGILKDITEQRLEAQALAEARAVAEAASSAKTAFLSTLSHEIRTPLNGVLGVAQALQRTELTHKQREMVSLLLSAGRSLKVLVDDALEIGRIEAGALVLASEPFSPADVVREAAELFQTAAAEKGLAFVCEVSCAPELTLIGDAQRVRQIVSNLVYNAVKFTREGRVDVALAVRTAAGGQELSVTVSDTGIGFDAATGAQMFERYVQGEPGLSLGGAGLGLAIAKSLSDAMKGSLTAASTPGRGATFTFSCVLPRAGEMPAAAPTNDAPFETQDHVRVEILVAEDNALNRRILSLLLSPFAARLTFANDGLEACEMLQRGAFDLVLMDVQMPVLDGLSAIRLIRAREALAGSPRTPIICLTAQATAAQAAAALEAGADEHIAKPIEEAALIGAIDRALYGGARRAENAA